MRISRRRALRQLGARTAAALAAPALVHAAPSSAGGRPIRLSANESAYGPPPRAAAVIRSVDIDAMSRYPEAAIEDLRAAIARRHGVDSERIVLGSGSGEILRAAAEAFLDSTRRLVMAHPTCPSLRRHAIRKGAAVAAVPLAADWSHDVMRMLERADDATALVYICNPNNPTGTLTRREDLERFITALPPAAHIVIDEAYHDYVVDAGYASFIDRPMSDARVIVTRSFSKAFGLAGLRVGYAVASPTIARRIASAGSEDGVTAVAALAAAAALEDRDYVRAAVSFTADDRREFVKQANARRLRLIESHTNFVMLDLERPAQPIVNRFARRGVTLPPPFAPLNDYIRVSLGTPAEMAEFWRVWDLEVKS